MRVLRRQSVRTQLAGKLQVTPRCIQVWFQNRRQKWKTIQKTRGVTPPALKSVTSRLESLDQMFPGCWNTVRAHSQPRGIGQPRGQELSLSTPWSRTHASTAIAARCMRSLTVARARAPPPLVQAMSMGGGPPGWQQQALQPGHQQLGGDPAAGVPAGVPFPGAQATSPWMCAGAAGDSGCGCQ